MEYGAFVTSHLMMELNKHYKDMAYDSLYLEAINVYNQFLSSSFNDDHRSEYECICDFLKNRFLWKTK